MADFERDRAIKRLESLIEAGARPLVAESTTEYTVEGFDGRPERGFDTETTRQAEPLLAWSTRVEAALEDVLPAGHAARRAWAALGRPLVWQPHDLQGARGILRGVLDEVRDGYVLEPLSERMRATTERELVEHARLLVEQGDAWAAAAWLLASAALELRLHDVARRVKVGDGPKRTIGQRFKDLKDAGHIDAVDDSRLDRWIAMRNDAAHRTATFAPSARDIGAELPAVDVYLSKALPPAVP